MHEALTASFNNDNRGIDCPHHEELEMNSSLALETSHALTSTSLEQDESLGAKNGQ